MKKAQVVHARVPDARREEYLEAWGEWTGELLPMGIECQLLESEEERGRFVELTWFEGADAAAMADDRLARINDRMERAAADREGARELYRRRGGG